MRYISPRFERLTGAIDLAAYERDSRILFAVGILSGIISVALVAFFLPHHSPVIVPYELPVNLPIKVRLVVIDPESATGDSETRTVSGSVSVSELSLHPTPEPEPLSLEVPTSVEPDEIPVQSDDTQTSLLHMSREPAQFTPYRDGSMPESLAVAIEDTIRLLTWEDTFHGHPGIVPPTGERERWEADIPLTENSRVFLSEGIGTLFWDPLNPLEPEPEDERRKFDPTFLGLPMGRGMSFVVVPGAIGFNAAGLLPSIQHFVKRMKWKYDDNRAENNRRELEEAGFAEITEQDIRFLILLWQYERLNPSQLTREDRKYLAGATSRTATTNRAYLEDMARRGLAVSLQKSGEIVYRAAVDRREMIDCMTKAILFTLASQDSETDSLYTDTRVMLGEYLRMILSESITNTLTQTAISDTESVIHRHEQDDHSQIISAGTNDTPPQSISD